MSAAWSEHFEVDTVCVEGLKGRCDILKLEPIKADFAEVSRQDINTGFLNCLVQFLNSESD